MKRKRKDIERPRRTVFLCDIRSAENAGAIMRTADAVGADAVVFAGYTPTPVDRFGRKAPRFLKASLGAEHSLAWRHAPDALKELTALRADTYIVAVEQDPRAIDYKKVALPEGPVVVVFGNEVEGLPKAIRDIAHVIAVLPMRGEKESLNVSVAAGVVLYRWFDV